MEKRILSVCESLGDDASSILMEALLEGMAEYYASELSHRIKKGISMSAAKCKFLGGSVPLGYKVDKNKNIVLDEDTAPIARTLFEMFVSGHNYGEIRRYLNECGLTSSKGGKWNNRSLRRIFSNRRYLGKYIYQDTEIDDGIPRIIDDELFKQAQVALSKQAPISDIQGGETV